MEEKRDSFKSRLGFLLVSAGCAIGIGNVWRFPYIAGQGGGLFVLIYLGFLVLLGVPVLTCELAVGRASRKSALMGYKALEGPKSFWHLHGWVCMIGNYLLMMYYTTVTEWFGTRFQGYDDFSFCTHADSCNEQLYFKRCKGRPYFLSGTKQGPYRRSGFWQYC